MLLGTLKQIWRYPVKSMGGECVEAATVNNHGLTGDRCWAVLNAENKEISHAKRWPDLLNFRAALLASSEILGAVPVDGALLGYGDDVPDVDIYCPNGGVLRSNTRGTEQSLSEHLGKSVLLAPLAPPGDVNHYRLAEARTEESIAADIQLLPGEDFPDFSSAPEEIMLALAECVTPPGSYVDGFPLHLLTTNSLQYLAEHGGVEAVVERYRPNLLIEPTESLAQLTENDWIAYRLQIGEVIISIHSRTIRCSMPSREQKWCGLKAEKTMARAMVDHCERHLGVNVWVEKSGRLAVGDEVLLLSGQ